MNFECKKSQCHGLVGASCYEFFCTCPHALLGWSHKQKMSYEEFLNIVYPGFKGLVKDVHMDFVCRALGLAFKSDTKELEERHLLDNLKDYDFVVCGTALRERYVTGVRKDISFIKIEKWDEFDQLGYNRYVTIAPYII